MPRYHDEEDEELVMDSSFRRAVIIDNLPKVPSTKYDKLLNVIKKIVGQVGTISQGGKGLYMPQDADGTTKGFAFAEFTTADMAQDAIRKIHGYKLDKAHTWTVTAYEDLEKFKNLPEKYTPPTLPDYQPKEDLKDWLMDSRARDQLIITYADETEVWWNDSSQHSREMQYKKRNWTDSSYVQWSPMGTYLATFHKLGVLLWGGPSWQKLQKFGHSGVMSLEFSPNEQYCFTFSASGPMEKQLQLWDVLTGKMLRDFAGPRQDSDEARRWPIFQWSYDDKYFARLAEDCIQVYETATMKLIKDAKDKRCAIKVEGVQDFCWSPKAHTIALWVPEKGNSPARVSLLNIPDRQEIRQKNLFNVASCMMHWQSEGDFLAVKIDRHSKTKKSIYTTFELFRMRDKDIPIEIAEVKDQIIAFAWEPKGTRFAIIHGENNRTDVSFYTMGEKVGGRVGLLQTLEKKGANCLFWSPQGNMIVLAGLRNLNGQLEFFNANEMETMGFDEHFMCTDVCWDPTGRYLATSVSQFRHQMENGYTIWSFQGKQIQHVAKDKFFQFLWRPRPSALLSAAKEKEIKKNLNQYAKKYQKEDESMKKQQSKDVLASRKQTQDAYEQFLMSKADEYKNQRDMRVQLRGGVESDADSDYTYIEDMEELEVDYKEELMDGN